MNKFLLPFLTLLLAACQATPAATPTAALSAAAITSAAPTPTASPTAEPTTTFTPAPPTPLPRTFTEEFDGAMPAWSLLQSNGESVPQAQLQDGALVISMQEPNQWGYVLLGAQEYTDARAWTLLSNPAAPLPRPSA